MVVIIILMIIIAGLLVSLGFMLDTHLSRVYKEIRSIEQILYREERRNMRKS